MLTFYTEGTGKKLSDYDSKDLCKHWDSLNIMMSGVPSFPMMFAFHGNREALLNAESRLKSEGDTESVRSDIISGITGARGSLGFPLENYKHKVSQCRRGRADGIVRG